MIHDFMADQIVDEIEAALKAGDVDVVPGLIVLLAAQDARRAQDVLDTIQLALAMGKAADGA